MNKCCFNIGKSDYVIYGNFQVSVAHTTSYGNLYTGSVTVDIKNIPDDVTGISCLHVSLWNTNWAIVGTSGINLDKKQLFTRIFTIQTGTYDYSFAWSCFAHT